MRTLLCLVLCFVCTSLWADPTGEIDVGTRKQIFIDNRFIGESENVSIRMNQPQKLGRIQDENGQRVLGHVSRVFEFQGKIRLYLGADSVEEFESEDGIQFRRTGVVVSGGIFTTVFLDDHDSDPSRRFKKFWIEYTAPFDPEKHGVYAAYSPDGVNYTDVGRVLPYYTDNPTIVMWDDRIQKYVIFTRALEIGSENQRRIARIETDDPLKPWPHTKAEGDTMFTSPRNIPVVLQADNEDNPYSDIYYNAATLYPWAQDAYFMFTAQFRHFSPDRNPYIRPRVPGQWEDFGLLEVQVAVSRDGVEWQRPSREPYFPTGLADEWDRWYAVMAPGMGRRGNYIYQYYGSSGRTHDSVIVRSEYDAVPAEEDLGGIGVVRQRLDGFFSADVDHRGGWMETPPILFRGNRLRLNIDTGSMGTAYVEIRDGDGAPIPGFTLGDCEEIGGNFIDQSVYWKGSTDVSALAGRPVRLFLKMTRAKLFAFQFTQE
ncbi:MAG: hypothetical protein AMXMBFR84_44580 [Candidatus Hydrogenedentota bacterium]